jgi:solute carrier family 5 (sodium-coupled monocarboxylate transporter), member 8/12
MMFGAMFLVIIKGTIDVGGLSVVIERNLMSGRIEAPE